MGGEGRRGTLVCAACWATVGLAWRVGGDAEELVEDRPRREPGIGSRALCVDPGTATLVRVGVGIRGADEHVGIDDEQRSTSFHRLIKGLPVGDVDDGAAAVEMVGEEVAGGALERTADRSLRARGWAGQAGETTGKPIRAAPSAIRLS